MPTNLTKEDLKLIIQRLKDESWGDIDPSWFEYIDIKAINAGKLNEHDYDRDHLQFQALIQGLDSPIT